MGFFEKIQDRKGRAARLGGVFQGREHRLGILMAALILTAAAVCGRSGGLREAVSKQVAGTDSRLVIIDAGHGGDDPGKIGVDGVQEKDLNLKMALALRDLLEQQDVAVLMTREDAGGLYDERTSNKKVQDMKRRIEIIEKTDPVLTVSIHQNSYPEEYVHGAQVFYYTGSMGSETLASGIQDQLVRGLDPENHRKVKANDSYYLLKKTKGTIVIVECGFLSNQAEAEKLCDEEYQDRIAWLIHKGILRYLKQYLSILSYL